MAFRGTWLPWAIRVGGMAVGAALGGLSGLVVPGALSNLARACWYWRPSQGQPIPVPRDLIIDGLPSCSLGPELPGGLLVGLLAGALAGYAVLPWLTPPLAVPRRGPALGSAGLLTFGALITGVAWWRFSRQPMDREIDLVGPLGLGVLGVAVLFLVLAFALLRGHRVAPGAVFLAGMGAAVASGTAFVMAARPQDQMERVTAAALLLIFAGAAALALLSVHTREPREERSISTMVGGALIGVLPGIIVVAVALRHLGFSPWPIGVLFGAIGGAISGRRALPLLRHREPEGSRSAWTMPAAAVLALLWAVLLAWRWWSFSQEAVGLEGILALPAAVAVVVADALLIALAVGLVRRGGFARWAAFTAGTWFGLAALAILLSEWGSPPWAILLAMVTIGIALLVRPHEPWSRAR